MLTLFYIHTGNPSLLLFSLVFIGTCCLHLHFWIAVCHSYAGIQGVILETNAPATAGGIPYFFLMHFLQLKHTSSRAFICYSILNRKDMHSQMLLGVEMRWTAVDPDLRRHDRQHVSLESTLLTRLIRFHTFSKVIAFFSPPLLPSVFPILTLITN